MATLDIKGVIPPMITPFTEGEDVDYDAFIVRQLSFKNLKTCFISSRKYGIFD